MSAFHLASFSLGIAATLIVEAVAGLLIAWIALPRLRERPRVEMMIGPRRVFTAEEFEHRKAKEISKPLP